MEFLDTLHPAQKGRALFEWKDEERLRWSFLPGERPGLQLGDLEDAQRAQLTRLMQASLSSAGYLKSEGVLILEAVLKELQPHAGRDPGKYVVTVFGIPGKGMWGWSLEGHHLSLNFTSDSRGTRSSTPLFFGVAPAVVESGSHKGLRLLGAEVDLAYALIQTLSPGDFEEDPEKQQHSKHETSQTDILHQILLPEKTLDGDNNGKAKKYGGGKQNNLNCDANQAHIDARCLTHQEVKDKDGLGP